MWCRLHRASLALLLSGCLRSGYDELNDAGYLPPLVNKTDMPCQTDNRPLGWDAETRLGFTASELRPFVDGFHAQTLGWSSGKRAGIELSLFDLSPLFVTERPSAGYAPDSFGRTCSDHIRIDATALLGTTDGALFDVERPISLRAYGNEEAFGELFLEPGTFEGDFAPAVVANTCFRRLHVKVLLTPGGFSGSLTQQHSTGSCEEGDLMIRKELMVGHWGMRWQSY